MTSVTFDTNVFPAAPLVVRAESLGIAVAVITVSCREVQGSSLQDEMRSLASVLETAVFGESRWGEAVLGSVLDGEQFERALRLLSNGAFPPPGQREQLTDGQRRQLRDDMIRCTHVRSRRDILVSNDRRAFIAEGRRDAIEDEFQTRVLTVEEFGAYLFEREGHETV